MTELNQEPNQGLNQFPQQLPAEAGAPPPAAGGSWPELPSQEPPADLPGPAAPGHGAPEQEAPGQQSQVLDPAVNAVLDRLAAVRNTPVSGHGEVYAGMHDALLEALNEDVAGHAGVGDGGS